MISYQGLKKLGYTDNDFVLQDDGNGAYIAEWNHADAQPTEAEIETAHNEWQTEYNAQEYSRSRKGEYPDIGDQLDDLFKAGAFSTEMTAAIQAVKDKYPKS